MFVGQLLPHVITIHICTKGLPLDYHGVAEGLSKNRLGNAERLADGRGLFAQRDCHWITLGLRRDCQRIAFGMLSDWRIAVGLPLDCLWIFGLDRIAFWIAFGFALGLAEDGDCQGVAYGLPMEYFGIMQGFPWDFPWDCQNFARVCPRD